jgi:signal transduction histidine kinase
LTAGDSSEPTPQFGDPRDPHAALRFIAHVSAVLAEALDYEATLAAVARLTVPFIADLCLVDVLDDAGRMQRVAAAHRDPAVVAWQREARHQQRRWAGRDLAAEILAAGRGMLTPHITPEILEKYVENPELRVKLMEIGVSSGITVPMLARGRALGAIILCLCKSSSERHYADSDLAIAEELARRAAVAIDNAMLYRRAQDAVRARDEFLTVASHELTTPITSLLMLAQTLQTTRAEMPEPVVDRSLELMVKQTRRLNKLVAELLDVTRVHAGALQVRRERIDLVRLLGDVTSGFLEESGPGRPTLALRLPARVDGLWDRLCLEQIVGNLVSNAIKFGAGKPIEIVVEELDADADGLVRLQVRDQGIGIPADRLPQIFGPFERAVSASNYGGLGLGLYIVKCMVHALQGKVTVESAAGAGATFTVELPKAPGP